MKFQITELLNGKRTLVNISKRVFLLSFILFVTISLLSLVRGSLPSSPKKNITNSFSFRSKEIKKCDVFSGKWVSHPQGPYYDKDTCHLILDQQNCINNGRPDIEFMNWRWKPDECELPLFNATQFLTIVRGKSMAFVGDSVGRNQMQSLLCLLAGVAYPNDISGKYTLHPYSSVWFYADYNFTLAKFWSTFLVRGSDADPDGHSYNSVMNLYLDELDKSWVTQIEKFDYVIISTGQWFFRPLVYYESGQIVGCYKCNNKNITDLTNYYGLKRALRTAFETLIGLKGYKGVTILRTYSPQHFENGQWNRGGSCGRTRPFTVEEKRLDGYMLEAYLSQVEVFGTEEKEARKKGLQFWLLDISELMMLRPDGHPNRYGRSRDKNVSINDCVHWCMPGPIDTWNEFLLYFMKMGSQISSSLKLQKVF
ncbi:hypothetical protein L6164_007661 [Bauhinia variegata]|uniref:Uncharacterized protein n=1 Tax=Bauhinia variegata TaxID=167791 RepID=A0ACB9PE81_BAUVA|nr:hypothetical protein L6164_007661 [Bauhinia variegata]